MRRGRLRLRHPARDRLLQLRELFVGDLALGGLRDVRDRASGRGACARRPALGLRAQPRRPLRHAGHPRRRVTRGRRALDVRLDDPAARPGAREAGQVEALLLRDPARERRGFRPMPVAGGLELSVAVAGAAAQPPLPRVAWVEGTWPSERRLAPQDAVGAPPRRQDPRPTAGLNPHPTRRPARSASRSAPSRPPARRSRSASRRRRLRRPCSPCRSRSRPARRRPRPRRRPASATAGSSPPPSSPRAAA